MYNNLDCAFGMRIWIELLKLMHPDVAAICAKSKGRGHLCTLDIYIVIYRKTCNKYYLLWNNVVRKNTKVHLNKGINTWH